MNPDGTGVVPDEPYWLETADETQTDFESVESFVCEVSGTLAIYDAKHAGEEQWMEAGPDSWEVPSP